MKRIFTSLIVLLTTLPLLAQGWPAQYEGVMLQGFYWDSYDQTKWTTLEKQADELAEYFSLVWLPQSANCGVNQSMGYDDLYWFPGHYDSSFGTEAELRSLIKTFKDKGIGTIADVVVNHRKNVSNWVDFPAETYKGVTYQLKSTDIVSDDDEGATKTWAAKNGYSLSTNNDSGEGWKGMRDLDHKSTNVQNNVKAYLKMLLEDFGYTGFRYDMVKGYSGTYTKIYNEDSKPQFSVGECWDGTQTISNWIDATGKTSAAFDFQFRYTVRNAMNNGQWYKLVEQNDKNWPLVSNDYAEGAYRQYAVTFVENHDTEKRSNAEQDPLRKDTLAANAYLLAMPGTPCVFLTNWNAYKQDIKAMIDARHAAGIQNTSTYQIETARANQKYAAFSSTGSKGRLMVVVGDEKLYTPADNWVKILSGYHYAYYMDKGVSTAWVDLPSGTYAGTQKATLTAVSGSNAQLVYTTDGSTPSASSNKASSGTTIDIEGDMTLKVGLLIGSTVSGIVTRTYKASAANVITIHVNTEKVNWSSVNFWSWGGDGSHSPANTSWPGDKVSTTTTVNGKQWYCKQFTINGDTDFVNLVFSTGSGSNITQTIDVNNVSKTSFFEIAPEKDGNKYKVSDVTSSYTGIETLRTTLLRQPAVIYDLQGRKVAREQLRKGIYIINGKKVIIK